MKSPTTKIDVKAQIVPFALDNFNISENEELIGSKYPKALDNAAKNINKKNINPNICPNGICINTFDIVTNNKLDPESGYNPNANTAGNVAKPAINAANVSKPTTINPSSGILESFFKYEPYTKAPPLAIPTEKKHCPSAVRNV